MPKNLNGLMGGDPAGSRRPQTGQTNSNRLAYTPRYVALYWTYAGEDGRPLTESQTIKEQRQSVHAYIKRFGGELIDEGIHEEPRDRPTDKIGEVVMALMNKAANTGATLIYVDARVETRWREHRFLKTLIKREKIRPWPIKASPALIDHFIVSKRRAVRKKKISNGVKAAIAKGAIPGLLTAKAEAIRARGREVSKANSLQFYADTLNYIADLDFVAGSFEEMAKILNERGRRTRFGKAWTALSVKRAVNKADQLKADCGRYVVPRGSPIR